jgi:putative endonuclease
MYYVYLLRSAAKRNETYVGSTSDLKKRLADHNSGKSIHTNPDFFANSRYKT